MAERECRCGHRVGQHELRGGGLLGCYIHGCLCIDFEQRAAREDDGVSEVVVLVTKDGRCFAGAQLGADSSALTVLGSWELRQAPRIPLTNVKAVFPLIIKPGSDVYFGSFAEFAADRGLQIGTLEAV